MIENNLPLLPLENMAERHQGLTPSVAQNNLEAARVCLDRHHVSPKEFTLEDDKVESIAKVKWEPTDKRTKDAWDKDDATEAGACAFAIAAIELLRELFAIRRMSKGTGADYYVALNNQGYFILEKVSKWT